MKKIFLLLALFLTTILNAQTTVHNGQVKVTEVPRITTGIDTLVFWGTDNKFKSVYYTDLLAKLGGDITVTEVDPFWIGEEANVPRLNATNNFFTGTDASWNNRVIIKNGAGIWRGVFLYNDAVNLKGEFSYHPPDGFINLESTIDLVVNSYENLSITGGNKVTIDGGTNGVILYKPRTDLTILEITSEVDSILTSKEWVVDYVDNNVPTDVMTLTTDQTASGDKVFSGELRVSGNTGLPWEGELVPNLLYLWTNYYAKSQSGTAGETVTSDDIVYQDDNTFKWFKASASNFAHATGKLGIVMNGGTTGNPIEISFDVMINGSGFGTKVPYYLSTTAGEVTETPPTGATEYVRVLGSSINTNYRYFNASNINFIKGDGSEVNGVPMLGGGGTQNLNDQFTISNPGGDYTTVSANKWMKGIVTDGGIILNDVGILPEYDITFINNSGVGLTISLFAGQSVLNSQSLPQTLPDGYYAYCEVIANDVWSIVIGEASGSANSPLTTKGDLWAYSTVDTRLPIGTDGFLLTADSAEPTGMKWVLPTTGNVSNFGTPLNNELAVFRDAFTIEGQSNLLYNGLLFQVLANQEITGTLVVGTDPTDDTMVGDRGYNNTLYEDALPVVPTDGYILSSTIAGVRSWVANAAGGGGNVNTSGVPVLNDFAKFVNGTDIEGRSYSETRSDLGLVIGANVQAYSSDLDNVSGINSGDNAVNTLYSSLISNVPTALSTGTRTTTTYGITSDGGTNDLILLEASSVVSGLLTSIKFDEIEANTLKGGGDAFLGNVQTFTEINTFKGVTVGGAITSALRVKPLSVSSDFTISDANSPDRWVLGAGIVPLATSLSISNAQITAGGDAAIPNIGWTDENYVSKELIDNIEETTTARTVAVADMGNVIYCQNGGATTVSIPDTWALKRGTTFTVVMEGAGQVTLDPTGTTLLNGALTSLLIDGQWGTVQFIHLDDNTDDWHVFGKIQ